MYLNVFAYELSLEPDAFFFVCQFLYHRDILKNVKFNIFTYTFMELDNICI